MIYLSTYYLTLSLRPPPLLTTAYSTNVCKLKIDIYLLTIYTHLTEYAAVRRGGGRSDAATDTAPHWPQCVGNVYLHTTYTLQPVRGGGGGETLFYEHISQPGAVIT